MLPEVPLCTSARATKRRWQDASRLQPLQPNYRPRWTQSKRTATHNQLPLSSIQTRVEEDTRSYLSAKLHYLSPLKRKADAAATTVIPLTTTHGGHPERIRGGRVLEMI